MGKRDRERQEVICTGCMIELVNGCEELRFSPTGEL